MPCTRWVGGALAEVPSRLIESWNIWGDGEQVLVVPEPVARLGAQAVRMVSQPALGETDPRIGRR